MLKISKILLVFTCSIIFTIVGATPAVAGLFPSEGNDVYSDTYMTFKVEIFEPYGPGVGIWINGSLAGPITIHRGTPYSYTAGGGQEAIDTELISMNMTGFVGIYQATLTLGPTSSTGMIYDINPAEPNSFPAFSFFDVYYTMRSRLCPTRATQRRG